MQKKKLDIDSEIIEVFYNKEKTEVKAPEPILPILPTRKLRLKEISKTETKVLLEVFESPPFEPFVLATYDEKTKSFNYKKKGLLRFVIINTFFVFVIALIIAISNNTVATDTVTKLKFIIGCLAVAAIFLFGLGRLHYALLAKHIKKQVSNSIH